jgi:hypothetical protein
MKPVLAHVSPTVPAACAAAVAIALSGFLLAGAGGQSEPAPLFPAIGSAAGRVIADLPVAAHKRVSEPVRRAVPPATVVTAVTAPAPQPRAVVTSAHRVHRPAPAVRRPAPARAHAPMPAPRATPVMTRVLPKSPTKEGKARGHSHSDARALRPLAAGRDRVHGHGKAVGHQGGLPPGQAKKVPGGHHPEHATSPTAAGGEPAEHGTANGHGGGKK